MLSCMEIKYKQTLSRHTVWSEPPDILWLDLMLIKLWIRFSYFWKRTQKLWFHCHDLRHSFGLCEAIASLLQRRSSFSPAFSSCEALPLLVAPFTDLSCYHCFNICVTLENNIIVLFIFFITYDILKYTVRFTQLLPSIIFYSLLAS